MSLDDPTETTRPPRGSVCVLIAQGGEAERVRRCTESVRAHTPEGTRVVGVEASVAAVNRALAELAPADVVVVSEPCEVGAGWLERLREAALSDTNTASASALARSGTALSLSDSGGRPGAGDAAAQGSVGDPPAPQSPGELDDAERKLAEQTLRLRPRLNEIVGPCVYVRRDALELVGPLDGELDLSWSLEVDFAQRCQLTGLAHVAADDVLVVRLAGAPAGRGAPPPLIRERYPQLYPPDPAGRDDDLAGDGATADAEADGPSPAWALLAASPVLPRALEAARRPRSQLSVTIDGRALGSTLTGTQRHIFELIIALSATGTLRMRVLVGPDTSEDVIEQLRALGGTEVLATGEIDRDTPRSSIFHRPQQVFGVGDMRFALRLGERLVLNQLDLIAYRNSAYHADVTAWRRYRRVGRQALAAADRVLVSSEHTRRELLSDELVDAERVRLVPPGLDHRSPVYERAPAAADGGPGAGAGMADVPPQGLAEDARFMLCLGTDFRHKNRVFALRLLDALRGHYGWDGRLAFAGTHVPHGSSRALEDELLARRPQLAAAVIELGSVGEPEKAWLMQRAAAVVYPSVYEGFGLVPLEAALSGVPCLFALQSSLADVLPAGAASILPWDPQASAARAYELLEDEAARRRHIEALATAAGALTWERAASATVEAYREALVAPVREAAALSRDEVGREHELRELIAAHDELVARLVGEREHARGMYDELNAEVGFSLSLIGPHGALPEDLQRALLALSQSPRVSGPLYRALGRAFRAGRSLRRDIGPGR